MRMKRVIIRAGASVDMSQVVGLEQQRRLSELAPLAAQEEPQTASLEEEDSEMNVVLDRTATLIGRIARRAMMPYHSLHQK